MQQIDTYDPKPWRMLLTYVLLVPLLFFAVNGYFSFEYARGGGGAVGAQWGSLASGAGDTLEHKIELACVFTVVTCLVLSRWRGMLRSLPQIGVFVVMALFALASTLWSQDPALSLRNAIYLVFNTLFALYLVKRFDPEQQMRLFLFLGAVAGVLSILVAVFLPKYGLAHTNGVLSWQGIFIQKNSLAEVMMFLLTPAFFAKPATPFPRFSRAAYIVLVLFLVGMSGSRTAWIATVVLLVYVACAKWVVKFQRKDGILLTMALLFVGAIAAVVLAAYSTEILALLGKNENLSGRTDIWKAVLLSIAKRPLIGYGYAAFWEGFRGESAHVVLAAHWFVSYAHNGFLEVALELGLIGLGLVVWTLIRAFGDAVRSLRPGCPGDVLWYISIILMMLLYNIDEARFLFPNTLEWVMYIVACAGLWQEARKIKRKNLEDESAEMNASPAAAIAS